MGHLILQVKMKLKKQRSKEKKLFRSISDNLAVFALSSVVPGEFCAARKVWHCQNSRQDRISHWRALISLVLSRRLVWMMKDCVNFTASIMTILFTRMKDWNFTKLSEVVSLVFYPYSNFYLDFVVPTNDGRPGTLVEIWLEKDYKKAVSSSLVRKENLNIPIRKSLVVKCLYMTSLQLSNLSKKNPKRKKKSKKENQWNHDTIVVSC